LHNNSKNNNSWSKSKKRKDINCYKCEKKGHTKRNCPNWKKNKDDKNKNSLKFANIVEDNSDDTDSDMPFLASNSEHPMDSWIMYFACVFHMTSNTDRFDTYRLVNSGIVTMGNGVHCKITGICNIIIKMFDGMVRMLCDVGHIPEVEKNLISLGTLDLNDYGYKSKGGCTMGDHRTYALQIIQRMYMRPHRRTLLFGIPLG
jgi:hypothetical protein